MGKYYMLVARPHTLTGDSDAAQGQLGSGGGLAKERVAREGQGRLGGYRMLVAYRPEDRAVVPVRLRQERAGQHRTRRSGLAAGDREPLGLNHGDARVRARTATLPVCFKRSSCL